MTRWTAADIPDQSGRVAVVTGANSGLGYITARELARHGATVVLASRGRERGNEALKRLTGEIPDADVELRLLDLASLESIRTFADAVSTSYESIDLLVNNAGVMAIPRELTVDGFERQFGTNHLGHFALTGLLLPRMIDRPGARIVTVSSGAHKAGRMKLDDLQGERSYGRAKAYSMSKLANLLFTYELQRRLDDAAAKSIALAAHPGLSMTNLFNVTAGRNVVVKLALNLGVRLTGQSDQMGALPQLYAATAPDVMGGLYFGPDGIGEQKGFPRIVGSSSQSRSLEDAAALWDASVALTGVKYDALSSG